MLRKNTLREIKTSLGRYIAILAIVALGVGFFSGLKVTREAMVSTVDEYLQEHQFYDYELISNYGFEAADVRNIADEKHVKNVEGSFSKDILVDDYDKTTYVLKALSITKKINTTLLSEGRMPEKANECIADSRWFTEKDIGKYINISKENTSDDLDMFKYRRYKITGLCKSPLYLNFERGSTSLGNGTVSSFFYIKDSGFNSDYFTEVYVKLDNSYCIYSDDYKDSIDATEDEMKSACTAAADRRRNSVIKDARDKLAKEKKKYNKSYQEYLSEKNSTESKLSDALKKINSAESSLASKSKLLADKKKQLQASEKKVNDGFATLTEQRKQFEAGKPYMTPEQIAQTEATLTATEQQLNASKSKIKSGLAQIKKNESKIKSAKSTLSSERSKYYSSKAKAEREFAKAKAKLDDGKKKLTDAEKEIDKIKSAKTYVLTRNENIGYSCFESDSNIVNAIAKVFPIFFFLVAALVCMTTMTRMVDEQRTQIGVLKALGYSNRSVMGKYLFYAGSASFTGAVIGFLLGCYLFPSVIWNAYGMMYDFNGSINYIFDANMFVIALSTAMICSMGATWISCAGDFRIVPAQLIRPKSPKNGKRILLERITPLWNKISFLYKVSLRNIFRYKKRFFMMIVGIGGCTALLLTALGINDSIKNIVNFQYDEICTYDYSVTFDKNQTSSDRIRFVKDSKNYVDSVLFVHEGSADYVSNGGKGGKTVKSVKLIVSDGKDFRNFIDLHTATDKISYPSTGEAVICEKLAKEYNIEKGDKITLRDNDFKTMKVKVSGICKNYVYNYVYVNTRTCQDGWGYIPAFKTAYVNSHESEGDGLYKSATKVQTLDDVIGTAVNMDMRTRVNRMMKSLDAVILLVIFSAGALAFIVLYNLTNINITERIREIATIKVLGFYPNETSAYVFRENFFLSGIGAIVGLFLGKILHAFVMDQIRLDLLFFDNRITVISYFLAVLLTFAFTGIVSIVMYFKLQRISMTESLKSIE